MAEVLHSVPSPHESQVFLASHPASHSPSPKPEPYVGGRLHYDASAGIDSIYREHLEDTSSSSHSSGTSSPTQTPADYGIRSPLHSTPSSSISLDTRSTEDDLYFPSYNDGDFDKSHKAAKPPPGSPVADDLYDASASSASESTAGTESSIDSINIPLVADDTAVRQEPSRQVDYLSHEWREEDIWSSWRHIVSRRNVYGERSRLENASWRTWAKSKYHLKTVSPKTLNWLKDCDVTWLYGPLQESQVFGQYGSDTATNILVKHNSFLNKKPILKKRTISEVMLQKSISSSSLIKQAAAVVQAQRNQNQNQRYRPRPNRTQSDIAGAGTPKFDMEHAELPSPFASSSVSGLDSPDAGGRRHIRFDDKVEQCIAVDFEPGVSGEDFQPHWTKDSDDSSDEELVMSIKPKRQPTLSSHHGSNHGSSHRPSFNQESKGIAMLPSTKLKYHRDEPDCPGHQETAFVPSWEAGGRIHESPSQETLRPSRPSSNFLLDPDEDDDWEPSGAFGKLRKDSVFAAPINSPLDAGPSSSDGFGSSSGLRRTPSGMFMPFDDDDDQPFATTGILGRVVDTVNTARDIAHVIWNVGWRK